MNSSNRRNKKEDSVIIQSRRVKFFATYQSQDFSLPDSVMFSIAKNPTSHKMYEKMIQTCKYFFVKNPVLVIPEFDYCGNGKLELSFKNRSMDLAKIISKLWITQRIYVHPKNSVIETGVYQNIMTSVIPKLYQCDANTVCLDDQSISCHDLSILISSAEDIDFRNITVKDKNGSNVGIEKIIEFAVKAKRMNIWSDTNLLNITSDTMKELIKLPHFSKLDGLIMDPIPDAFDLEAFYNYMKQNKTTKLWLGFDVSITEAFKNRLNSIVDEILANEPCDYKPPFIYFARLDNEKYVILHHIYYSS